MFTQPPKLVAIVGAGLAGLNLALSLHRQNIKCVIYELRYPTTKAGGALMLSPNALRILDSHGMYKTLSEQGYNFETIAFQNPEGKITDYYYLGSEKLYDYKALRVYREILLTELRKKVSDLEIPIVYGRKFTRVVSESADGVTFEFADGTTETADLLIGADGIHSTVRKYIVSDVAPQYSGTVAITCAIQKSNLTFPENSSAAEYPMPVAIHGKAGAFVMAPQDVPGEEVLAGTQIKYPEQDRAGWDAFLADKQQLLSLFRANYATWPTIVKSALDHVPTDTLGIWPYYVVPKLADWTSPGKRVIIVGDAAHAIPPTAGQGASQGFEDTFTLAALLANVSEKVPLEESLGWWKDMRQERVNQVIALTLQLNNARLPQEEREKLMAGQAWQSGDSGELAWLYSRKIEEDVLKYVDEKKGVSMSNGV